MLVDTIAVVFARSGSKGLPGKNLQALGGKPLVAWAIEHAASVSRIGRIVVSTDSEDIAAVAREHGAETPFMRPPELAQDDTPEWLAWRHALSYLKESEGSLPRCMVSLPPTAPLRIAADIDLCLDAHESSGADAVVTVTEPHRNPYFNMVKQNEDGGIEVVIPSGVSRRQDCPAVYDMATVAYVVNTGFVLSRDGLFDGRVHAVQVPRERAIDIDTALDLQLAECLLSRRGAAA